MSSRLDYIPTSDSILYNFIDLVFIKDEKQALEKELFHIRKDIILGGPYDKEYGEENISKLATDYAKIINMFKEVTTNKEDDVSDEELADLTMSI